jgi:hypothetical protein
MFGRGRGPPDTAAAALAGAMVVEFSERADITQVLYEET